MSKIFEHKIRVRYGETDKMGFVYYGNYALYLEEARTELIRKAGISYKEMEEKGIELPVVNLNITYRKPALYDDELLLKTTIDNQIGKKISFNTTIFNSENQLLIEAVVILVFIDSVNKKVISCPEFLEQKLAEYIC
ncbi:MAG: acyl-CoA thioesterase [Bacteroidetes bacterium]|nr:acyl-CoA thioesterase [Bacteroidota bacterium]